MKKDLEGVQTIYRKGQLVAIIKRDTESKKHIVYLCSEATSEDIAGLMEQEYIGCGSEEGGNGGIGNFLTNANPIENVVLCNTPGRATNNFDPLKTNDE